MKKIHPYAIEKESKDFFKTLNGFPRYLFTRGLFSKSIFLNKICRDKSVNLMNIELITLYCTICIFFKFNYQFSKKNFELKIVFRILVERHLKETLSFLSVGYIM